MARIKLSPEETERIFAKIPAIEPELVNDISRTFTQYIFYETNSSGRTCTCTSCGKTWLEENTTRVSDDKHRELMSAKHNDKVTCTRCGRVSTLKSIGKCKTFKNIYEEQKIIIIYPISRDEVFITAFYVSKDYKSALNPGVRFSETSRYYLRPGEARMWKYSYDYTHLGMASWDWIERCTVFEPFSTGQMNNSNPSYRVFGSPQLADTFLKYCSYDIWSKNARYVHEPQLRIDAGYHYGLCSYLGAYVENPKLEMLVKLSLFAYVELIVWKHMKLTREIKWSAKTPWVMFGLDKPEFESFRASGGERGTLVLYNKLRGIGEKVNIETAGMIYEKHVHRMDTLFKLAKAGKMSVVQAFKYLEKQDKLNRNGDKFIQWKDYLDAAAKLRYDLSVPPVYAPRNLRIAHDNAVAAVKYEASKRLEAELQKRLTELTGKYSYESDGFIIIPPKSQKEIIAEGKALSHCVGGYAARHAEGKLAILFLRSTSKPDVPLVTIEMQGERLNQAHGKGNRALLPDEKAFVDKWLGWLKSKKSKKTKVKGSAA